jgi:hypothetical protein
MKNIFRFQFSLHNNPEDLHLKPLKIEKNIEISAALEIPTTSVYITDMCWLVGDHLLLKGFEPYGIFMMYVYCYNSWHGNSVTGFWTN